MGAAATLTLGRFGLGSRWNRAFQQQLEQSQGSALGGMKQSECANSMQSAWRHVLQESTKKLVGVEGHRLTAMVATVAVGEGNTLVVAVQDRLVGQCCAMHVASEVLERKSSPDPVLRVTRKSPTIRAWTRPKLIV